MRRLAVLALPGIVTFDFSCAMQVFGHVPAAGGDGLYNVLICAAGRTVRTSDGLSLRPDHPLAAVADARSVVVPGYRDASVRLPSRAVLQTLQAAHRNGARMVSFCVGAFALGHAGLLDGRRAATHWDAAGELAEQFPAATVDPGPLYIDAGSVMTSAGMAAALDLALHIVREDHGAATAAEIARWNVVAPHRDGGQAQYISRPAPKVDHVELGATRAWLLQHLEEPLTLADIAAHAYCSERSLTRRFKAETGVSPKRWLLQMRVQRACELLQHTDLPIGAVAGQAGFPTGDALRHRFADVLDTTPTAYRRTFASGELRARVDGA